ncbi:MAG: sigma-70 family RNA polymerase sigma factor [Planctomycetota bacterium]
MEQREFREVFLGCLAKLPKRQARALYLREIEGLGFEELGGILNVSATNLSVILHRARRRLRVLLENHWDGGETPAISHKGQLVSGKS